MVSVLAFGAAMASYAAEFHVANNGDDANSGSPEKPLKTVAAAANKAMPGDTVTVHAGIYRELVVPPRGGTSDACRITYQAAPGGKVVITGAEPMKGWEHVGSDTWKVVIPNAYFEGFNPFSDKIQGEWCDPTGRHAGMVYLNGDWFAESLALEPVLEPAATEALWFARVDGADAIQGGNTTVWAQFPGVNPNEANVEINKRRSVFYPSQAGLNFITVRGFTLRQAATPWAGAMSEQVGLVGTHWSKGWIIENNDISYSMCTGVTLGRYELPKHEFPPATAPGFVKSVELALRDGWSREKVGSHIVRNNHISHCGKNAVHGSLGASFSEISGNDIHDIAVRNWVQGADTAGIKFLGGVDMIIRDNHIHRCGHWAGIWLDWMAQGAVVTGNLLHDNSNGCGEVFFEMQHGPLVFANNILLSNQSITINSEGLALAHNLIAGKTSTGSDPRETPFHPAHALTIAGLFTACGGDHRIYNNLLPDNWWENDKLPNSAACNVVTNPGFNQGLKLSQKSDGWYLAFNADPAWRDAAKCKLITTALLGKARISNCAYEHPNGTPLNLDTDYFGKPRSPQAPFPGPFENIVGGPQEIKVWPK
jgi:alpha-N-arabinofuranosidase